MTPQKNSLSEVAKGKLDAAVGKTLASLKKSNGHKNSNVIGKPLSMSMKSKELPKPFPANQSKITNYLKTKSPQGLNGTVIKTPTRTFNQEAIRLQRKSLPIAPIKHQVLAKIRQNNTVIFIGETACGKTTQIPQYIFESGIINKHVKGKGLIGITQPRRVAAISIAQRVAEEMNSPVGKLVGYSVRFEQAVSEETKIKYLTDGMLLRESISDRRLMKYSVLILDEAHERTVNNDILLGIAKAAQRERLDNRLPPLRIIVMSATMDVDHFSKYFNNAPVAYIPGRLHPIKMLYAAKPQDDYVHSALVTVFQIHQEEDLDGNILVFCTGQEDIETMVKTTRDLVKELPTEKQNLSALPLYSHLPSHLQMEVFEPTPQHRKVIFSTNIAETSVTIPGIKHVIDSGLVKIKTFHPQTKFDCLKAEKISKAQALQRAGRAGRESSGNCYRLYTKEQFDQMSEFSIPEIKRCSLSSVILQLLAIGIKDVTQFDFIDKPDMEHIEVALKELEVLGAVKPTTPNEYQLTEDGRKMARFPLEPRYSKMIIEAPKYNCLDEILTIISVLSVENIFHIPSDHRDHAGEVIKKFHSTEGDAIMMLNVYKAFKSFKKNQEWIKEHFLDQRNLRMAIQIRKQLGEICLQIKLESCSAGEDTESIRKCMTVGLRGNAAILESKDKYKVIETKEVVQIHPSSCLFRLSPECVIFTDILKTSKSYIRNCTPISHAWIDEKYAVVQNDA